jgi:hypothetical protein
LHLDYVREKVYHSFQQKNAPFNEKKTLLVKNFFRKLEEQSLEINDTDNAESNALIEKEL